MGSEWQQAFLTDLYEIGSGLSKPAEDFGSGYPFLAFKDIFNNVFVPEQLEQLVQSNEKEQKKCSVLRGDVFLTRTSETMDELGMSSVALKDYPGATFNGFTKRLRPKEGNSLIPEYVAYYLRSPSFRTKMLAFSTMSTRASLNNEMISRLTIDFPNLEVQSKIAGILKAFDDKIALNRQINTTLESMAQALFKSWFVDFDPVIDNALAAGNEIPDELAARAARREALRQQTNKTSETTDTSGATDAASVEQARPETGLSDQRLPSEIQQLFPDRFVLTEEMGWVPEGWEVKTIGDVVDRFSVGKKFSQKTVFDSGEVPVLDQGKSGIIGFHNEKPGILASPNDPIIVFANHTCYMRLVMHDFSAIQNVLPFKGKSVDVYWLFYGTLGKQQFNEYKGHWPDFVIHNLVLPKNHLDRVFGEYVSGMCKGIYERDIQNESLANLRDSLLPKLLSGQITIPDAEQQLAEVL